MWGPVSVTLLHTSDFVKRFENFWVVTRIQSGMGVMSIMSGRSVVIPLFDTLSRVRHSVCLSLAVT